MTNIWHYFASGGFTNTISQYRYGYDDAGQRTYVKRANGNGDIYKYDAADQLTNVLYEASTPDGTPSGGTNNVGYRFDAAGNRTSVVVSNSAGQTTTSYTANALNQYTAVGGVTPTYDGNGSLTFDGTWTYTWDRENRLIQAANGSTTIAYAYDALHRLIKRTIGTSETRFYYDDQWRLLEERDENDAVIAKYVYGPEIDEPVRMTRNNADYYYHAAALGTVTEITGSAGTLVEQYRYDVYGEPQSASTIGNRLMFDGRDRDPDTGLYNIRYRWYSPGLGRWPNRDPLGEPGFEALRGKRPSIRSGEPNRYLFVENNPVSGIDPEGLTSLLYYYQCFDKRIHPTVDSQCGCICAPTSDEDCEKTCKSCAGAAQLNPRKFCECILQVQEGMSAEEAAKKCKKYPDVCPPKPKPKPQEPDFP